MALASHVGRRAPVLRPSGARQLWLASVTQGARLFLYLDYLDSERAYCLRRHPVAHTLLVQTMVCLYTLRLHAIHRHALRLWCDGLCGVDAPALTAAHCAHFARAYPPQA